MNEIQDLFILQKHYMVIYTYIYIHIKNAHCPDVCASTCHY